MGASISCRYTNEAMPFWEVTALASCVRFLLAPVPRCELFVKREHSLCDEVGIARPIYTHLIVEGNVGVSTSSVPRHKQSVPRDRRTSYIL